MTSFAVMPSSSTQTLASGHRAKSTSKGPSVSCFWQPQNVRPSIRRRPPLSVPRAFGRTGYWGCAPGMMGSPNMAGMMNKPLAEILQQIERDFNNMTAQQAQAEAQRRYPGREHDSSPRNGAMGLPVDSIETDEAVWYFTDLPGMEKKDLQIKANQQNRTITISGERFQPTVGEDDGKEKRNLQRRFGKFSHTIALPKDADPQLISAKVDKGVLRVKVLKATDAEPELQNVPID